MIDFANQRSLINSKNYLLFSFILSIIVLLGGCETWDYSPYEVDSDGRTNINSDNIARFIDNESDTTIIAVIGDTQRFYNNTEGIISKINALDHVDFVAHTGDIVDFGLQREYNWTVALLDQLDYPYVAVVGNHDLIGNGENIYKKMFGPLNFSFTFNNTKYLYINTCSREYGFDPNVPDVDWLQQELSDSANFSQAIIIQHVAATSTDFNVDLLDDYMNVINNNANVILNIVGHSHYFLHFPSSNGAGLLNSYGGEDEQFVILKVWEGGYEIEVN